MTADTLLYRDIVENANELITVFDTTGSIVYINRFSAALLGYDPLSLVGRGILEFVHPDDRVRAQNTLRVVSTHGTVAGTTHFRLRCADGSYKTLEMSSGTIENGRRLMTMSRPAGTRFALDSILRQLLENRALEDVMASVCDLFAWRALGTHVAVAWRGGDDDWRWLATPGCPRALVGAPIADGSPWDVALRTGQDVLATDLDQLPGTLRTEAADAGRGGYWITAIPYSHAVLSIWTAGQHPPEFHAEGMQLARQLVQLILRWGEQHDRLDRAARFDELTGLANRPSFFSALASSSHGAVLYCDLDRFKVVNDRHGHAAGDDVLREVARRLQGSVRSTDLIARIGGDEFAIICPSSSHDDAEALALRVRAAVEGVIAVAGAEVQVGISIGIAHTTEQLDAASVADADQAMLSAKAARRAGRDA